MGLGTSEDAHMRATMIVRVERAEMVVASHLTTGFWRREVRYTPTGTTICFSTSLIEDRSDLFSGNFCFCFDTPCRVVVEGLSVVVKSQEQEENFVDLGLFQNQRIKKIKKC